MLTGKAGHFPPISEVFARTRILLVNRKKYIIFGLLYLLASFALLSLFTKHYLIGYAPENQRCLPQRLYFVERGVTPVRNDYISFKGKDVPHTPDGITWTKIATGVAGDRIETRVISREERELSPGKYVEQVDLNGMPLKINIQGYVYLYRKGTPTPQVFRVFEKDRQGRALPMIEAGVIPQGKYFVTTPAQRSYDSRYWGLVDKENVIGKAHPFF